MNKAAIKGSDVAFCSVQADFVGISKVPIVFSDIFCWFGLIIGKKKMALVVLYLSNI